MGLGFLMSVLHIQDVGVDIAAINAEDADRVRTLLKDNGIVSFDVSGSIGSGKTLLVEKLIERFKDMRVAVLVGDIDASYDAGRIQKYAIPVIAINTGKDCHLDAHRVLHALEELDLERIDLLFVENVGNLICPTDFDLGCDYRIVVVSVTEGDDTIKKQPAIFAKADLALINKTDLDAEGIADILAQDAINAGSKKALKASLKTEERMKSVYDFFQKTF